MSLPGGSGSQPFFRGAGVVLAAFLAYGLTVLLGGHLSSSGMTYFNELAGSFLHGRLDVAAPSSTHDLTPCGGRWYLPFPPLPALLMIPQVAIFGTGGVNAIFFSIVLASLGVLFFFLFLEALSGRGLLSLNPPGRLWLAALFGLGTVYWSVAVLGSVWYLGQVSGVCFVALAAWLAVRCENALWPGLALGLALLGRPNLIFTLPFLWFLSGGRDAAGPRSLPAAPSKGQVARGRSTPVGRIVRLLIFPAAAGLLLLWYNHARFGKAFDFGYREANVPPKLAGDLRTFGQFHLHYLGRNLKALLLLIPRWDPQRRFVVPDMEGMSLLLTTPAVVWLVRARGRGWARGAWISLALLLVPLVLYYNTGWIQFGYRFSLDFLVPMAALLALAAGSRPPRAFLALLLLGILVNLWGAVWWMTLLHHG